MKTLFRTGMRYGCSLALLWCAGCAAAGPQPLGLFPEPSLEVSDQPLPQPAATVTKAFLHIFAPERSDDTAKRYATARTFGGKSAADVPANCQRSESGRTIFCTSDAESPYGGSLHEENTAQFIAMSDDGKRMEGIFDQQITLHDLVLQTACGSQFQISGVLSCHFSGTITPSADGSLIEETGNCHTSENADQTLAAIIDDAPHTMGLDLTMSHRLRFPAQGGPAQLIERSVDGIVVIDGASFPYRTLMQQPVPACAVQEKLLW